MSLFKKQSNKKEKNKQKEKENPELVKAQKKVDTHLTFTKVAIGFVLINSELQIWASYMLAFLGREAIAEALSQQIVITIIGTVIGYFAKSLIENLSKYTTMFGRNLNMSEQQYSQMYDSPMMREEMCNDELENIIDANSTIKCDGITPIDTNIGTMM